MEEHERTSWIVRELNRAEAAGAMFYLNDNAYTKEDSEYLQFVLEKSRCSYMAGYIGDADGRVTEVHVHRICDQGRPGMAGKKKK